MQLVPDEGFPDLLRTCKREAFHLEVLDSYAEPNEHEPFRRFLADEPDDYAWFQPWTELIQETTSRGVAVTRVRIVTEPHTDYTRFALAVAALNVRAGEDIRYLPGIMPGKSLRMTIGYLMTKQWSSQRSGSPEAGPVR